MQGILKKLDVDQAKLDLKRRRHEILVRQAEESQTIDAESAQLDTLNHLIDVFTQKFPRPMVFAHAPVATPVAVPVVARVAAPAVHQSVASKAPAAAGHHRPRGYHLSNFAEYTRAIARV